MPDQDSRSRTLYPVLAVSLTTAGFITLKTGRDALYFQDDALRSLPWAYIWIAMASMPAAMIHLRAMSRWGPRRTRTGAFLVSALMILAIVPFLEAGNRLAIGALFVVSPAIFAALFAGAWLLAGDLLEGSDPKDLAWSYSRIGVGGMIGGFVGGLQARGLATVIAPRHLVTCGAAYLIFVGLLIAFAQRRHPRPADHTVTPVGIFTILSESRLVRHPYLQVLTGIAAVSAIATLFIDFQFYGAAIRAGSNNAAFFADFYIIVTASSLGLQLLAPRIQSRIGVAGSLLILPGALLGLSGTLGFGDGLFGRSAVKVAEGGLKSAIHRSVWEQAFLPIETECRGFGKIVVDGLSARLAEGLGAALLLVWMAATPFDPQTADLTWITWGILFFLICWIALTRYLGRLDTGRIVIDEPVVRIPDG